MYKNQLPDHLSHSQITTYLQCPLKYRYQYVDRIPWPFVPDYLTFGTAIHKAIESFYRSRQKGREAHLDDLCEVFSETLLFDAASRELKLKKEADPTSLQKQGEAMLKVFEESVQPSEVIAVEEEFEIELVEDDSGEAICLRLKGRVDLVERTEEGELEFVDFKTASKSPSEDAIKTDMQLTAYSLYARCNYMVNGDPVKMRLDVLKKTKTPCFASYPTYRTCEDSQRYIKIIRQIRSAMEGGHFYPNPGWQCGDCPFRSNCPVKSIDSPKGCVVNDALNCKELAIQH